MTERKMRETDMLVSPELLRYPSAETWAQVRTQAHGAAEADVQVLDAALETWPIQLRRIVGTQERADDWWHQGEEPEAQPWLGLVRTLEVGIVEILDVPASSAWDVHGFPKIRRLELSGTSPKEIGQALSRLPRLEELNLSRIAALRGQPAKVTAAAPPMRALELAWCGLSKGGLEALQQRHGHTLERLDLRYNEIGVGGVEVLAKWKAGAPLHDLRLSNCILNLSVFARWAHEPLLQTLRHLDIGDNPVHVGGRTAHLEWLSAPNLEALRLSGIQLGDELVRALVERAELPALRRLELANTRCSFDGVNTLIEAGWLGRLEVIDLSHNHLDDQIVERLLIEPPGRLQEVLVGGNDMSPISIVRLREWVATR